jgi:hypothetical protein
MFLFRREVTIHVCDESRGMKKDFVCPQNLLLSRMVYFRYFKMAFLKLLLPGMVYFRLSFCKYSVK